MLGKHVFGAAILLGCALGLTGCDRPKVSRTTDARDWKTVQGSAINTSIRWDQHSDHVFTATMVLKHARGGDQKPIDLVEMGFIEAGKTVPDQYIPVPKTRSDGQSEYFEQGFSAPAPFLINIRLTIGGQVEELVGWKQNLEELKGWAGDDLDE